MSFDIVCKSCGAPSSPSVGVCPYCKNILSDIKKNADNPTITNVKKFYNEGKTEKALYLADQAASKKPSVLKSQSFIIIYVKILLEVDAPSSKIRNLLAHGMIEEPESQILNEYLEIVDAKSKLSRQKNDLGELELANVIRRSPKNIHALFLLGSHLFWVEKETQRPLKYLQSVYRLRPQFLRSTACLASLLKKAGQDGHSRRLFRECAKLESNKLMKAYFKKLSAG